MRIAVVTEDREKWESVRRFFRDLHLKEKMLGSDDSIFELESDFQGEVLHLYRSKPSVLRGRAPSFILVEKSLEGSNAEIEDELHATTRPYGKVIYCL